MVPLPVAQRAQHARFQPVSPWKDPIEEKVDTAPHIIGPPA
jgi:hypothetical protein